MKWLELKLGVKDIEITGTVKDFAGLEGVPKSYDAPYIKAELEDSVYGEDKRSRDIAEDSVSLYIAECSRTPLLTGKEERILAGRMELSNFLSLVEKQLFGKGGKGSDS